MKVFVVGGSGLVGSNIVEIASERGTDVHSTYLNSETEHADVELDKTDPERTIEVIRNADPDVVVDTAAFHAVDDCESKRDEAWSINVTGTRNVAVAANAVDAQLIYLSTDYVFPGNPDETPYVETDPVRPLNYYAETKYAAERAARIADTATILRPSVVFGLANDNFATWALSELDAGNELGIVDDQVSRPTYAPDLAEACLNLAETGVAGLYHATGPESLSRYEFTRELAQAFEYDLNLVSPISSDELGQQAPRPEDSSLDSTYLYNTVETPFRPPRTAFEDMESQYTSRHS